MTLNLWNEQPPFEARMRVAAEGLRALAPDVVALQEVRVAPGRIPNQAETLAAALGYGFVFEPAAVMGDGEQGLAIISRLPIIEHAAMELPHAEANERRIMLSARLETQVGGVWVHTTHLDYRLAHGREREDQVLALEQAVAARASENPQVLVGDFNARPESDEIRWLCGLTTLAARRVYYQDAWALLHPGDRGWTWASANPYTERMKFLDRDRRIDYIFVTQRRRDGRGAIHDCQIVLDRPDADGVFASDHFGLVAEVQISPDDAS